MLSRVSTSVYTAPENHSDCNNQKSAIFHPFPRLPTEVRLKIFKLCVPKCRVVEVRLGGFSVYRNTYLSKIEARVRPETQDYHEFHAPFPNILHVSREARAETLPLFVNLATKNTVGSGYFNPELDVLCIRELHRDINHTYVKALDNFIDDIQHIDKVSRLAFTNPHLHMGLKAIGHRMPMILKFPNIQQAILLETCAHPSTICTCGGPGGKFVCIKHRREHPLNQGDRLSTESVKYFRLWLKLEYDNGLRGRKYSGHWKEPEYIFQQVRLDFVADDEIFLKNVPQHVRAAVKSI